MPPRSTLHYAAAAAVAGLLALPATGFAPGPRTAPALLAPSSLACAAPRCHRDAGRGRRRLMMSTAAVPPEPGFMAKLKAKVPSPAERKKLIPLALMFFCILFNYMILRDTKDVLLVTARGSGAEVIPFIKTYLMLPSAISFTTLYSKLSPHIRNLATLVISYGMCINLVEVSWKAKLHAAFPDPNAYAAFMGNFSSATGTVTLFMMLIGRKVFSKCGWWKAALVTPSMIGITGLAFWPSSSSPRGRAS